MEYPSNHLSGMTTPDESTRPDPSKCVCGAEVEPYWMMTRWASRDICSDCEATRKVEAVLREKQRKVEAEAAAIAWEVKRAQERVAPSERSSRMTFETYDAQTDSQRMALSAMKAGSVWLHGKPGCGKTHLATAAALDSVSHAIVKEWDRLPFSDIETDPIVIIASVERWLVADLMARVRSEAMAGDMEAVVDRLSNCDLLVLDDLGVERTTPLALETLYRIVDSRYEHDRRTIVTSNAAPSVVAKAIGARVHSRLVGMCEVIKIDGSDWRLQ